MLEFSCSRCVRLSPARFECGSKSNPQFNSITSCFARRSRVVTRGGVSGCNRIYLTDKSRTVLDNKISMVRSVHRGSPLVCGLPLDSDSIRSCCVAVRVAEREGTQEDARTHANTANTQVGERSEWSDRLRSK